MMQFDVIIIGGSYSGISAGLALARALKQVLIIDSGAPCNQQTPFSHNFITHDGKSPLEILSTAKKQLEKYSNVSFIEGLAIGGTKTLNGFEIYTESGKTFSSKKLIFATGIKDIMPSIDGFADCWGKSVLHCPYCHGYEVRGIKTGILGNGNSAYEYSKIIFNWTKDLTLFTNGKSELNDEQTEKLKSNNIQIIETEIELLKHNSGYLKEIVFKDNTSINITALYSRRPFDQHCKLPELLGCEITEDSYIKTDIFQRTTVKGIFACGDNSSSFRTASNAVAMGTNAGMNLNKELLEDIF